MECLIRALYVYSFLLLFRDSCIVDVCMFFSHQLHGTIVKAKSYYYASECLSMEKVQKIATEMKNKVGIYTHHDMDICKLMVSVQR
jgi:hypothetical protein